MPILALTENYTTIWDESKVEESPTKIKSVLGHMYRCNEPLFDLSHGRCTVFLTDNNGGDPLFPMRYTGSISFDQHGNASAPWKSSEIATCCGVRWGGGSTRERDLGWTVEVLKGLIALPVLFVRKVNNVYLCICHV